jgi:hypothetical protein
MAGRLACYQVGQLLSFYDPCPHRRMGEGPNGTMKLKASKMFLPQMPLLLCLYCMLPVSLSLNYLVLLKTWRF